MTAETLETYATDQRFANSEVGWFLKCVYFPWQCTPRVLPPVTLRVPVRAQHAERMEAVRAPRALLPAMLRISVRAEHAMRDLIASNAPLRTRRHKVRQVYTKTLTPGDSRGRSPLTRLSPLSFVVQRKMGPPEVVPRRARLVKTRNKTISPPEGLPKRECL